MPQYTMNGTVPITMHLHYDPNKFKDESHLWSSKVIQEMIDGRDKNNFCAGQSRHDCFKPLKRNEGLIKGRTGLVIGSDYPWAEALLLRLGASKLITVERILTDLVHPALRAYTPAALAAAHSKGLLPAFDFAFAFSFVEHEGLGKEGEALAPDGDLELMKDVFCLLRPGGVFFVSAPLGPDSLHWNTYRTYGPRRLPLLLAGWELIDVLGNFTSLTKPSSSGSDRRPTHKQPLLVLRRPA